MIKLLIIRGEPLELIDSFDSKITVLYNLYIRSLSISCTPLVVHVIFFPKNVLQPDSRDHITELFLSRKDSQGTFTGQLTLNPLRLAGRPNGSTWENTSPPPLFGKRIPERMKIFTPKVFIGENIVLITY